jgi:hypothetical protein
MKNLKILTAIFGILALLVFGCSNDQNPVDGSDMNVLSPTSLPLISLPSGAVLDSAILSLYVNDRTGGDEHHLRVHRITTPWDEGTVTWNSILGGYDPTVSASCVNPTAVGWQDCDITSIVQDWLDGTYPDYGILIEQPESGYTRYCSSEFSVSAQHPILTLYYTLGAISDYVIIQRGTNGAVADAGVLELYPNTNYGNSDLIYTATVSGLTKMCLFKFDVEVVQEPAAIGDTVWIDEDQDGIQDADEPGFPDVTVNLYDCLDNLIATTTTDGDGFYKFDGLTPGDYYVEFIKPEGYAITLQDQGADDSVDSDADPVTGIAACTTLDPGEYDPTWDCGLYLMEQDGCTLTIGFWKTHCGFGPQANVLSQYLPIWLGDMGGSASILVSDSTIAHDILMRNVYGNNSNGITKLYAQLLGAKLNIAAGADPTDVAATIAAADAFLAIYDYTDWGSLSKPTQRMVIGWMSDLDDYNNGDIGPGHCGD